MILTRRQVISVLDAHLNLDGSADRPSKFAPKTRYALAKNIRLLTSRFEDLEKVKTGMIRELAPTTFKIEKDSPEAVAITKQWEAFQDADTEDFPNLMRFTLAELNLDVNDLPIVVLAKLGPVIIEDADVPAK
jgi:hypothetical protein